VIVLNLKCDLGHRFEGWFGSAEKFASQREAHEVACPICGSVEVERAPCAPAIARSQVTAPSASSDDKKLREALQQVRQWVQRAENVGQRFPEEARRMHYGETEKRDIRGTASISDMVRLSEEGINVLPVPAALAEEGH
jgi:hypothetical protein